MSALEIESTGGEKNIFINQGAPWLKSGDKGRKKKVERRKERTGIAPLDYPSDKNHTTPP
jgi:hypothetical protein